jgi:excinuclease ABC subunit C
MFVKIPVSPTDKEVLEELAQTQIYLRTPSGQNLEALNSLLEDGRQNALVYLQRNSLGQRLSQFEENNLFKAVVSLQRTLGLQKVPRRIECYDISHLQGKYVYGSMVTFVDGRAAKKFYRLFKCPERNDDFANHKEVLTRRLTRYLKNPEDKGWQLPDMIIVDGGKGQLSSDWQVLSEFGLQDKIALVSLAKKEEEVFTPFHLDIPGFVIPQTAKLGSEGGVIVQGDGYFLLQRIRDEAHRFAITNNRNARLKEASKSALDDLQGVGEKSKQKILVTFGSFQAFVEALDKNPELVAELLGNSLTEKLKSQLLGE